MDTDEEQNAQEAEERKAAGKLKAVAQEPRWARALYFGLPIGAGVLISLLGIGLGTFGVSGLEVGYFPGDMVMAGIALVIAGWRIASPFLREALQSKRRH
jgi:hypothetical protein